ncbi:type II secretion system F family protein [Pseudonocardia ailaonensis]|uniref:Type II secretion system F family protein n=1 Tax=Pseudonocardia ailaonensis TaxID=367279 RepID=A0ABN2NKA3_9PSEU
MSGVLAVLATAVLCAPGSPARQRVRALGPAASRRVVRLPPARTGVIVVGLGIGALACGIAGAVAGAVTAAVLWRRRERAATRARTAETSTELADSLARIVEELRAGAHPAAALDGVRSDGPRAALALGPAAAAARLGDDVPAALARTTGPASADLRRVAAAWALADRHGAPLAQLLAGTLTDLRWRVAFEGRVRARMAGPRSTATVLALLPLLGLGLGHLLGADPIGVLREGVLGQVLVLAGTALLLAGLAWADRIAAGPVSS